MSRSSRFILGAVLVLIGAVTALVLFGHGKRFSAGMFYQSALEHSQAGEYDKAIADFNTAIRLDPKKALYFCMRGAAYSMAQDYPKAVADFDEALRLDPHFTKARFLRGDACFLNHDYTKALEDFNAFIRSNPHDTSTLQLRGAIYNLRHDYKSAIADFTEVIRLKPKDVALSYTSRANSYQFLGEFDKAIADCNEALKLNPDDFTAYYTRANACKGKGRGEFGNAMQDYNKALRLRPDDAGTLHERGELYTRMGERDKAMEDYSASIRIKPNALYYLDRAILYMKKGDLNKALEDENAALRLKPDNFFALTYRGSLYAHRGEYANALADYRKAITHDSTFSFNDYAWFLATCPDATYRDGKQAVEYAIKACALGQWNYSAAIDTLAAAYAESGDFEKAVSFQTWYLALTPDNKDAETRLELYKAHQPYRETPKESGKPKS